MNRRSFIQVIAGACAAITTAKVSFVEELEVSVAPTIAPTIVTAIRNGIIVYKNIQPTGADYLMIEVARYINDKLIARQKLLFTSTALKTDSGKVQSYVQERIEEAIKELNQYPVA